MEENQNVSDLIVKCLEQEGVEYVFGIPGEENIKFVNSIYKSDKIKFVLVRHEQGASFMADAYGRISGKPGVCTATLGPGAINLLLGVTDAQYDSTPLVAITAQVGLDRIYKETHQTVDLVSMFKPVTKYAEMIITPESTPEMVRKAFDAATSGRAGASYLAVPEDVEAMQVSSNLMPILKHPKHKSIASEESIFEAVELLKNAKNPVVLIGHGAVRGNARDEVRALVKLLNIPTATTFMSKGLVSDREENVLGVIGFMNHDYENFAFDKADLILSIGYDLIEFKPKVINPNKDKVIIHIHNFIQDTDANFMPNVAIESDIKYAVNRLLEEVVRQGITFPAFTPAIKKLLLEEITKGKSDTSFPIKPQFAINAMRSVLKDDDILISDTGAVKMWIARLYEAYEPNTSIISNGLATMAHSLPGAIGAYYAKPSVKTLAVMGDGSFMMNSQEIETAVRENVPLKILIWEDKSFGLIKWKMDMEINTHNSVDFSNPDFVKYAESFGAKGYRVERAEDLQSTLEKAMNEPGVSLVVCPVDYSENMKLTSKLGTLSMPN